MKYYEDDAEKKKFKKSFLLGKWNFSMLSVSLTIHIYDMMKWKWISWHHKMKKSEGNWIRNGRMKKFYSIFKYLMI